jgi:molecular chaperone GrpE
MADKADEQRFREKTELEKKLEAEAAAEGQARARDSRDGATGATNEELAGELAKAQDELRQLRDQNLRVRAEMDNFRKRTAREVERMRKTAAEDIVRDLLPVLDHMSLALQHTADTSGGLAESVQMVMDQLLETLQRHGLEPVPALNEPFDPNVHEAVMQRDDPDVPAMTVLEEFQKGYRLGGQVMRPARVVVSTGGPERPAPPREQSQDQGAPQDETPVTD